MYEPGTILQLREPQSTDDVIYPYDRVIVVGQSPIQHSTSSETPWAGLDAIGCVIRPLQDHAPTLDKPYGELEQLYDIESWPLDPITQEPLKPENNPRNVPSPLQLLRQAEEESGTAQKPRKPLPSLQQDGRSPVQVLREAGDTPAEARKKKGA